jgi:F0F1-type ATP synthase gamma subunit
MEEKKGSFKINHLDQKKINIFVRFANAEKDIQICVFASDLISNMFKLFPKGNKIIMHRGKIIQPSLSFEKCDIVNNERIHIIYEEYLSMNLQTKNRKSILNPDKYVLGKERDILIRKDFFRIMDLHLLKFENNEKQYRKVISQIQNWQNETFSSSFFTCLKWKKQNHPNDKILPTLW